MQKKALLSEKGMIGEDSRPPKVFISYKWEDDAHNKWVEKLATDLRKAGIDAILDRWEVRFGDSFTDYMTSRISEADAVLFVITMKSVAAVEAPKGRGGALKFEMQMATARRTAGEHMRLIGVYREGTKTPAHLRDHRYADFRDDSKYAEKLQELIDDLLGRIYIPPVGKRSTKEVPSSKDISDAGLTQAQTRLNLAFDRWEPVADQYPPVIPSWEETRMIMSYADRFGAILDERHLTFMLVIALWHGQDVIYWAQRNQENKQAVPILLQILQRPERRPPYRVGLALEYLAPSLRSEVIQMARSQSESDERRSLIIKKAEKGETLKFWENELSALEDASVVDSLIRQAKASRKVEDHP